MLNYINDLQRKLDILKNKMNVEKDSFKLIDLENELIVLEDRINYSINLVFKNYNYDDILAVVNEYVPSEVVSKATDISNDFNLKVVEKQIRDTNLQKDYLLKVLNSVLKKNPNAEKEEFKDSSEYKKIKKIKRDIEKLDDHINEQNSRRKSVVDSLSDDYKQLVVSELLGKYKGKENNEELLNKAISYKDKLNLLLNASYPLSERFKELTANDDSLAKYLLENEDDINRLTVTSSFDVASKVFDYRVKKVEDELAKKRYINFSKDAKKKGIGDLVDDLGQFKNKKIYKNNENYKRFKDCITEIKTSDVTKDKIKKLLRKLDSLDILDSDAYAGESKYKEYGFVKFLNTRQAFIDAMNENPSNEAKIKSLLENLKKEESKIYEIYGMINEELGDDLSTIPSNVDSYRNAFVPPCFKENLALNAKFNSLFIMLTFIKEKNLDIDEFVEKPLEISNKCLEENFNRCNIDNLLKDKSKGEALLMLGDSKNFPIADDPFKYTRSFELIYKSETNEEYDMDNHISSIAINAYNGDINRAALIGGEYFLFNQVETIQNVLMAKKNAEGMISYLDCYVSPLPIQEDPKTSLAYDERETIVEKIKKDDNIIDTFYEAIDTLKYYANNYFENDNHVHVDKVFAAVQELAVKIIVTLDIDGTSNDQKRGYPESFVDDLTNIITDYKEIVDLKDFNFNPDRKLVNSMFLVVENKKTLIKTYEKNMNNSQQAKEDSFIREFKRINEEIDELDKQADRISKNLKKGTTNQEIENIALEQRKKFIELQELQNSRLKELKEDLKKGMISKFYFEQRTEQVKLLDNIKDKPAMFMCDDKKYKNFKTYAKEILKINIKDLNNDQLRIEREKYNSLIDKSKEDKNLYLINNILKDKGLSLSKSFNYEKVEEIVINDNIKEMKELSSELLSSNQKIKENASLKKEIVVDLNEPNNLINDEKINEKVKNIERIKEV